MENPYQTPITQQNKDPAPVSLTTGVEFLLAVLATGLLSLTGLVIHWACQIAPYDAVLENQIWVVLFASTLALVSIPFARTRRLCLPVSNLICALAGIATLLYLGYSAAIAWYLGVHYEYYAYLNRALAEHLWIFQSIIAVLTLAPLLFLINRLRHSVYLSAFVQAFILTSAAFFLRVNFIMQYSDEFPTSWLQFFWPAVSSLP